MAQTPEGVPKQRAKMLGISLEELLEKEAQNLRRCTKCKQWKPTDNFGKDKTRGDGINPTCLECKRVKERKVVKGRPSHFKGKTHSEESRQKMSEARKGNTNRVGKTHTEETKQRLRERQRLSCPRGPESHSWKGGASDQRKRELVGFRYREWRRLVFERDNYTCQHCQDATGGNLHAHHIQTWAEFPDLRYEVSNGLTLCRDCHEKVHLKPIPTKFDLKRRRKHRD